MRKHKTAIALAGIVVIAIGWYLFRPERLFINKTVNETLSVAQANTEGLGSAVVIASGKFHGVAHNGAGTATIYRLAGGKRILRFTDFETSNGPDVQVYLVAAPDAGDSDTVKKAGFVHLGALKGNRGDQNYDIPSDVDLGKYRAATIWCRRFAVNFATAPLMEATGASGSGPVAVEQGRFHSVAHNSSGTATVYQYPDGNRILRFTNFETSNGPDVQVYLVAAPDATDSDTVKKAGFVHLGALKGNQGDQNYDIPPGVDLNKYRAATIWCRRFGVNFGTAPLAAQASVARAQ
jgi:hypothetical protein